jgi:hypothetical protein
MPVPLLFNVCGRIRPVAVAQITGYFATTNQTKEFLMAEQPVQPNVSLDTLAAVINEAAIAASEGVEYAEYLKNLRRIAKEAQDTLDEAEKAYLDNLRQVRDDAQAKLAAAETVADACIATKSRKTRKDAGKPRGPKNQTPVQQTLIPDEPAQDIQAEPQVVQNDQPF